MGGQDAFVRLKVTLRQGSSWRERERERASLRRILESIDRKSEEKFHHSSSPFPGPSILQQIEREAVVPLEDVRA